MIYIYFTRNGGPHIHNGDELYEKFIKDDATLTPDNIWE